jgi:SAM-dependent methyltransferase
MKPDLSEKTIADFGAQWTIFVDNEGYYGSIEYFLDTASPLLSLDDVRGATVADIGSGTGRFVLILLAAGAKHVYAVEPSAAFEVLKRNTLAHKDQVTLFKIRGDELPTGLQVDLVFSYGVIHHIPDPLPTLRAAHNALRPGGKCCVWIYGHEGNEFGFPGGDCYVANERSMLKFGGRKNPKNHRSIKSLQKRSCPFLPFSKQETFSDSVSVHEFNAGLLQSGLDRLYGLLGNQSPLFFKIDDRR